VYKVHGMNMILKNGMLKVMLGSFGMSQINFGFMMITIKDMPTVGMVTKKIILQYKKYKD
jgi:hypothetical protein